MGPSCIVRVGVFLSREAPAFLSLCAFAQVLALIIIPSLPRKPQENFGGDGDVHYGESGPMAVYIGPNVSNRTL